MNSTVQHIRQLIAKTNKYRLEDENNEGASAYAFRAHHVPLNLAVFLKVIDADPVGDLFAEPRLLVEATQQGDNEKNLVRVHDAERLGDDYVLVAMEFVQDGSISSHLQAGPLPMMDAVGAAIGILHGVAQLHRALLLHRDIKPGNVLVAYRHGRIWPKITDFGSVARFPQVGGSVTGSRHSSLYTPPEAWEEPRKYDARSDIYQVGLVLFEMVHGALPYDEKSYLDRAAKQELQKLGTTSSIHPADFQQVANRSLARAAAGKGVIAFGEKQPYVPKNLARIINKAISPDPAGRYQTASEMIGVLETLRLPNWKPSIGSEEYLASAWGSWNWSVRRDPQNGSQWVVRRSRVGADNYRRWGAAQASARAACRLAGDLHT